MTLPAYDSTKHHIGLAPVGDPLQGLMLSGGYRRDPQRYGGSSKYGGTDDQIGATTLSRWTEDDFSGGAYQERFRDDAAMFLRSKNFLPHQVDDSARTVPPLLWWSAAGVRSAPLLSLGSPINPNYAKLVDVFPTGGTILLTDTDKLRFYSAADGTLVEASDPDWEIQAVCHDPADNKVYSLTKKPSDSTFQLRQIDPSDGTSAQIKILPDSAKGPARGMIATAGRDLLVSMNDTLWLADVNDDRDDATLTRLGRLPGRWRDACTYAGMTYLLLTDYAQHTQLVSWDGTQVLPVTDFPYNFIGNAVCVYGGRIYVAGTATDTGGTERYAEMYEVTGSSLRLLKTFGSEARAGIACPGTIYDMAVFEGLLFFATDKSYLIAYDLTRDALWPEIEVQQVEGGGVDCLAVFSTRERLFVYGYDHDRTTPKDGFYRMAVAAADMTAAGTGGAGVNSTGVSVLETSEFSPEPDRDKRWSQLRAVSRYSPSPTLEYSQDGGDTWTALASASTTSTSRRVTDWDLSALPVSGSIRFRFAWTKTDTAYSEMIAFTTSFLMLDSGKCGWAMTVLGVDKPENLDGTMDTQDVAGLKETLWGYWTNKETLDFRDTDGTDYTVYISDVNEAQALGPDIDGTGTREAYFAVQLTEV